jgi:hypothetical protein
MVAYVKKPGQADAKTCGRGETLVETKCEKMTRKGCPTAKEVGEKCNGKSAGTCDETTGECTCKLGNVGKACDMTYEKLKEKREATERKQEATRRNQKTRDAEKSQCTDKAKRIYCEDADYVLVAMRKTCVGSKKDCVDPGKTADYKASAKTRPPPPGCDDGEKLCKDGTCAADCSTATDPCKGSTDGSVSCGDGITCKKTKNDCRQEMKL